MPANVVVRRFGSSLRSSAVQCLLAQYMIVRRQGIEIVIWHGPLAFLNALLLYLMQLPPAAVDRHTVQFLHVCLHFAL